MVGELIFCYKYELFFAVIAAVTKENTKKIGAGFHGRTARRRTAFVVTVKLLEVAATVTAETAFSATVSARAVVSAATTVVSAAAFTVIVTRGDGRQRFVFQIIGNNDDITVRFFAFTFRFRLKRSG